MSESYSLPTLNKAHLQEQTDLFPVPVNGAPSDEGLRGPSLMRNSSVEISSIPFGTDTHRRAGFFLASDETAELNVSGPQL